MKPNNYIYIFTNPLNNEVLYVGRSNQQLPKRFVKHLAHLKSNQYIRHPFKCKLQSLYTSGVSYEKLLQSFTVIISNLTTEQAILEETRLINEVYGLDKLLNIASNGSFGGDMFTNHPNKEQIRLKLQKRVPWNKGTKGVCKPTKTSYKKNIPRTVYVLTSPDNETYTLTGKKELTSFCKDWKRKHKASSVKDKNWLSPTAFQLGTTLKGWKVQKITVPSPQT